MPGEITERPERSQRRSAGGVKAARRGARDPADSKLERETGFEPATSTLARSHSTTELFPPAPCETIRDTLESVASVHPKPLEYHTLAVAGKTT